MGQKINPVGLRLGVNRTWDSRWFAAGADYSRLLHQDLKLREWLRERLSAAGVSRIIIERPHKKCRITIYAARPGVVIGKKGADIEKLRKDISARTEGEVHLNIIEVRKPAEVRMGKGKGAVDYWAARCHPGRILFEIDGVSDEVAREALRLGAAKLPVRTKVVTRIDAGIAQVEEAA